MSEGGTLFLDEIGELPLELQPKLLRFVQDREYERVGESAVRRADVRVIAATNVKLEEAVRAGQFREDLFYRINVVQIDLLPLRRAPEDIDALSQQFAVELGRAKGVSEISADTQQSLRAYNWPGNIRELRNVIERTVILSPGREIGSASLPSNITAGAPSPEAGDTISLAQLEETHIRRVLASTKSLEEAAKTLGIDVATLWRRRKKYGI